MISKISELNKIGKFLSIEQDKPFIGSGKNQNCNIIFGFNGSGKTTLSNAISFFANNSFISEEEKKEIYEDIKNSSDAFVKIRLNDGNDCKYPADNHPHSKSIYIFNSNFVAAHVFNGTKGRLKKFLNTSGEIKNKEIDNINEQITKLSEEKIRLENENQKLDEKFEEIRKKKEPKFQ